MNVLFDTCIIIDAMQSRDGFSEDAQELFRLLAEERITGYITAKSFTDIYYIMHSYFHDKEKTLHIMQQLLFIFKIADTSASDVILAMDSRINDYEDAVQAETARRFRLDMIITRDNHFKKSYITAYSPSEAIKLINN